MTTRLTISSGTRWEEVAGYSRAVRVGKVVEVAGTTAVNENNQVVGANDPYQQTRFILAKIEKALASAGASMKDVVRTRMFVIDISGWEEIARAHGEVFQEIKPASTMVEVNRLISPELLVEIEATAIIND
jgi:enamine deaminase RidA (YjgF/YER057c/UK114 family)